MHARQVVILNTNSGKQKKRAEHEASKDDDEAGEEEPTDDEENLLDAKTIFKYNIIKKKNPNVKVVTELINSTNIAFLLDNPLLYHFMSEYGFD